MALIYVISARADAAFTDFLLRQLSDEGYEFPSPEQSIEDAVRIAMAVVLVLSPDSAESIDVTYAWAFALGIGARIVPIMVHETEMHPRLTHFDVLDFTDPDLYPWRVLFAALERQSDFGTTALLRKTQRLQMLNELSSSDEIAGLVAALNASDPGARSKAAETLGKEKAAGAVGQLIHSLEDTEADVRRAAANALGQIQDESAVSRLLVLVRTDDDPRVRAAAVESLWSIGDPGAASGLRTALADNSADVRKLAAYALAGIKDIRSTGRLEKALADSDVMVRVAAAQALGEMGQIDSVPELAYRLRHDTSVLVRGAAAQALGKIDDPACASILAKALRDEEHVANAAMEALEQLGTEEAYAIIAAWRKEHSTS